MHDRRQTDKLNTLIVVILGIIAVYLISVYALTIWTKPTEASAAGQVTTAIVGSIVGGLLGFMAKLTYLGGGGSVNTQSVETVNVTKKKSEGSEMPPAPPAESIATE